MQDRFPEQLTTSRLIMRPARGDDGPVFHAAVSESLDHLRPWLAWVSPPPSLVAATDTCTQAALRHERNEDWMTLLFLRETGELIGGSGLHRPKWTLRHFEVGYWARSSFLRRGLITEGVRALAEHALNELNATRVFLTTDERNSASRRVAERAGFELEGVLRNERLDLEGRLRNTCVYARVPVVAQ